VPLGAFDELPLVGLAAVKIAIPQCVSPASRAGQSPQKPLRRGSSGICITCIWLIVFDLRRNSRGDQLSRIRSVISRICSGVGELSGLGVRRRRRERPRGRSIMLRDPLSFASNLSVTDFAAEHSVTCTCARESTTEQKTGQRGYRRGGTPRTSRMDSGVLKSAINA
jgi:hypothetical protein